MHETDPVADFTDYHNIQSNLEFILGDKVHDRLGQLDVITIDGVLVLTTTELADTDKVADVVSIFKALQQAEVWLGRPSCYMVADWIRAQNSQYSAIHTTDARMPRGSHAINTLNNALVDFTFGKNIHRAGGAQVLYLENPVDVHITAFANAVYGGYWIDFTAEDAHRMKRDQTDAYNYASSSTAPEE